MLRSLVVLLFLTLHASGEDLSTLQSVQIFFRHGQRYPSTYVIFPSEDPKMADGKVHGELTTDGMRQEFNLGQNLRETYGEFIGERYNSTELLVMTGFDNRTSASALAMLAALLPPQEDQIFHDRLMWQPIPVHSEPILDMVSFGSFDWCPALVKSVRAMPEFQHMDDNYTKMVSYYEKNGGIKIPDVFVFQKVLDSVKTRSDMQDVLPLPTWANDSTFINHSIEVCEGLHTHFIDLILGSTGAWHFDLIVENIRNRIHSNSLHKTYLFAVHDANIMTMAKYLNLPSDLQTTLCPYAAYIAFEHHNIEGKDVVKVISHMHLNGTRQELAIADCPSPCLFSTFRNLKKKMNTDEFTGTCRGFNEEANVICQEKVTMIAVLLIIVLVLFVAFIGSLFACFWYRARLRQMTDPERRYILQ
ncbi:hypothetical protein QR680_018086 [Steinernema hermaphroditum]|uniref:Acid phosphatase n=1 Tax=Steinernema hermaphroditum TaxID=289476 RepID=A0AA39HJ82_9BILA|nr:hypothetical protein QR680_018086 [Steinernema hermaphroditum]